MYNGSVTWDVMLSKDHAPKFPELCSRCGAPPTTTIEVKQDAVGWWSYVRMGWLYAILGGRGFKVPVCEACAAAVRRDRWIRKVGENAVWIVAAILAIWLFGDIDGIPGYLAFMGVGILVALPWVAFEIFHPPAVDLTVTDASVTFHFTNQDFAKAFATENPSVSSW
jgi:hypothetical protein